MKTRSHRLTRAALVITSLVAPAIDASAQDTELLRQPATVPTDLAVALASAGGFGGGSDPQILVGALPEWVLPRLYLPPGARILGSAFIGPTLIGVLYVPTRQDTLVDHLERMLLLGGWNRPPSRPMGGGFQPAPSSSSRMGSRLTLCRDQQTLFAWTSRQRRDSTTLYVRLTSGGEFGICNPQRVGPMYRSPFPTLYDPEGTSGLRSLSNCERSLGGSSATRTNLRTAMPSEAILDHYGRQLQDSGWTRAINLPPTLGRTWSRPDSTGAPQQLTLTVSSMIQDSTCRIIELNVTTTQRP